MKRPTPNQYPLDPVTISCPACHALPGNWCERHGMTQPGRSLMCVARTRAAFNSGTAQ